VRAGYSREQMDPEAIVIRWHGRDLRISHDNPADAGIRHRWPDGPSSLTATGIRPGSMRWTGWTSLADRVRVMDLQMTPWTALAWTFHPRVLGSNPSRLTTFRAQQERILSGRR
jgi:hypothetical protein